MFPGHNHLLADDHDHMLHRTGLWTEAQVDVAELCYLGPVPLSTTQFYEAYDHADDPHFSGAWAIIKVLSNQYLWLAGGYDQEIGHVEKWLPGG